MKHIFKINLLWNLFNQANNNGKRTYKKSHLIKIDNKEELKVSAAKAFKGDASLVNPEDLLLSSLASCHMMSYLYCCEQEKIEVISYIDNAVAELETYENGSGKITKVILNPKVKIAKNQNKILALNLHEKANELCFIANSCNFKVFHNPTCEIE